ncbi:MAG: hypothetical protein JO320_00455 [Alphaproteobacteria bacterium]|nr:hypothetical protein [Alphaproteobacteria bacterium]
MTATSLNGRIKLAAAATALMLLPTMNAWPHGFAGERFFPATILTDDPFVADEISLPQVSLNPPTPDGSQQTDIQIDLSKRITPNTGFVIGDQWQRLRSPGVPSVGGLGPLHTGAQYQLFVDGPHQALGLLGLNVTWAHTGRVQALGAPDFTTLSPTFNFGKGFGDIPRSLTYLRPFAITGNLGFDFPTKTESAGAPNPTNFNYGFAFEYSLPYLQCCVKDIGLRAPFNQLFPLVEISFSTAMNRGLGGQTIGTVQPGIIWAGQYFQIGAEAIIPATRLTGHGYGGVVQLHFYLDDIFPRSIGRPISEW